MNKIDWNSLIKEKPTIRLLDDKGNVISVGCHIREDGYIVCDPINKEATIVGWSLGK